LISDTIAAIATPIGNAALAIIRISGKDTFNIVKKITHLDLSKKKFRRLYKGTFLKDGKTIDQGMLTLFPAKASYTGEDMAELYCHGSQYIVTQLLETILQYCRPAERGEFTLRAFLNKKIDLTQAEAVGNLLTAKTEKAHQAALSQLNGHLFLQIQKLLDLFTDLRVTFELAIDFIEDEVPNFNANTITQKIDHLLSELKALEDTAQNGMIITQGLRVCLIGPPNVGKSSIFNAFLQTSRAIITEIPGTTRDYLEEDLSLEGYLIKLFDTAGIRDTQDPIEKIGIQKTQEITATADLVINVQDDTTPPEENSENIIRLINKIDLMSADAIKEYTKKGYIPCSATQPNGIDALKSEILRRLKTIDTENTGIITNARQLSCVKNAHQNLQKAKEAMKADSGYDFIAFDIATASAHLEEIIGKVSTDDVLNKIFSEFCIGK